MKSIELCANFWTSKLQIVDKREVFKAALTGALFALWDSKPEACQRLGVFVGVDYDPDRVLLRALHVAGIPCAGTFFSADGILPQKTRSWIYPDRVDVCNGYGGPIETLAEEGGDAVCARLGRDCVAFDENIDAATVARKRLEGVKC